jgi:hypothetical protein
VFSILYDVETVFSLVTLASAGLFLLIDGVLLPAWRRFTKANQK